MNDKNYITQADDKELSCRGGDTARHRRLLSSIGRGKADEISSGKIRYFTGYFRRLRVYCACILFGVTEQHPARKGWNYEYYRI